MRTSQQIAAQIVREMKIEAYGADCFLGETPDTNSDVSQLADCRWKDIEEAIKRGIWIQIDQEARQQVAE